MSDYAVHTEASTQSDHQVARESRNHAAWAISNATRIDARGIQPHTWIIIDGSTIVETGTSTAAFTSACAYYHIPEQAIIDAQGSTITPGYIDIHAHGACGTSFDDGVEGILTARRGHMAHGTTRQVLSLITNPIDTMCANLETVHSLMAQHPDILGSHLEGPFLALARKGAHDPNCLIDPTPEVVSQLLEAADGSLRQITIAAEREHGLEAIRTLAQYGVVPALGHCDADYTMAQRAYDAGARILTHMFNAMNGIHHREPGPIPATLEDPRISIELINDGFHVANPVLRMALAAAPHRIAFVTDAMAATCCPDGAYKLGALDVQVIDGHARLVSNGAIAGSTLLLEVAVQRAIAELGVSAPLAVEAATLTPAHALGLDQPNAVTTAPLGLLATGYAADMLILDTQWQVQRVWCNGVEQATSLA